MGEWRARFIGGPCDGWEPTWPARPGDPPDPYYHHDHGTRFSEQTFFPPTLADDAPPPRYRLTDRGEQRHGVLVLTYTYEPPKLELA